MWPQLLPKVMCGSAFWTAGWPVNLLLASAPLMPRLTTPRPTQTRPHTHKSRRTQRSQEVSAERGNLISPVQQSWPCFPSPQPRVSHVCSGNGRSSCLVGGREQIEGLKRFSGRQAANSSQHSYSHHFLPLWSTTHLNRVPAVRSLALTPAFGSLWNLSNLPR